MSLSAKELFDRYHAAAAGKRAIGDPPLPSLEKEPHASRVGWDAVAWLANQAAKEAVAAAAPKESK